MLVILQISLGFLTWQNFYEIAENVKNAVRTKFLRSMVITGVKKAFSEQCHFPVYSTGDQKSTGTPPNRDRVIFSDVPAGVSNTGVLHDIR